MRAEGRRQWLCPKNDCGILQADGPPDDLEHLDAILGDLLSGKFAERTKSDEPWHCEIPLKVENNGGFRGKLIMPDCPGEEWQRVFKNRADNGGIYVTTMLNQLVSRPGEVAAKTATIVRALAADPDFHEPWD